MNENGVMERVSLGSKVKTQHILHYWDDRTESDSTESYWTDCSDSRPTETQSHWIQSDPAAHFEKKMNSNLIAPSLLCLFVGLNNLIITIIIM